MCRSQRSAFKHLLVVLCHNRLFLSSLESANQTSGDPFPVFSPLVSRCTAPLRTALPATTSRCSASPRWPWGLTSGFSRSTCSLSSPTPITPQSTPARTRSSRPYGTSTHRWARCVPSRTYDSNSVSPGTVRCCSRCFCEQAGVNRRPRVLLLLPAGGGSAASVVTARVCVEPECCCNVAPQRKIVSGAVGTPFEVLLAGVSLLNGG